MIVQYKLRKLVDRRLSGEKTHAILLGVKSTHGMAVVRECWFTDRVNVPIQQSKVESAQRIMIDKANKLIYFYNLDPKQNRVVNVIGEPSVLNDFAKEEGYDDWDEMCQYLPNIFYGHIIYFEKPNNHDKTH